MSWKNTKIAEISHIICEVTLSVELVLIYCTVVKIACPIESWQKLGKWLLWNETLWWKSVGFFYLGFSQEFVKIRLIWMWDTKSDVGFIQIYELTINMEVECLRSSHTNRCIGRDFVNSPNLKLQELWTNPKDFFPVFVSKKAILTLTFKSIIHHQHQYGQCNNSLWCLGVDQVECQKEECINGWGVQLCLVTQQYYLFIPEVCVQVNQKCSRPCENWFSLEYKLNDLHLWVTSWLSQGQRGPGQLFTVAIMLEYAA